MNVDMSNAKWGMVKQILNSKWLNPAGYGAVGGSGGDYNNKLGMLGGNMYRHHSRQSDGGCCSRTITGQYPYPYNDTKQLIKAMSDLGLARNDHNNTEYYDDELVEPNVKPVPFIPHPDDLPVPTVEYVAANTPHELHSLIAIKCKKDCRTWLWKSAHQRSSCLMLQQQQLQSSGGSAGL